MSEITALSARTVEQTSSVFTHKKVFNMNIKGTEQFKKHTNKMKNMMNSSVSNSIFGIAHTLQEDSCATDELREARGLAPVYRTALAPLGQGYGCRYRYRT